MGSCGNKVQRKRGIRNIRGVSEQAALSECVLGMRRAQTGYGEVNKSTDKTEPMSSSAKSIVRKRGFGISGVSPNKR